MSAEDAAEATRQGLLGDLGSVLSVSIRIGLRVARSLLVWAVAYMLLSFEPHSTTNDFYLSAIVAVLFSINATRSAANGALIAVFVLAIVKPETCNLVMASFKAAFWI